MNNFSQLSNAARLVHPEHEESSWIVSYSRTGAYMGGVLGIILTGSGLLFAISSGVWLRNHLGLFIVWIIASMVLCFLFSIMGVLLGTLYGLLAARIKQSAFHSFALNDAMVEISLRKKIRSILYYNSKLV